MLLIHKTTTVTDWLEDRWSGFRLWTKPKSQLAK